MGGDVKVVGHLQLRAKLTNNAIDASCPRREC
jgi:hypothetical protein